MTRHAVETDAVPPQWAERLLRLVLPPADRDTITGDLLEEYREVIRPTHGPVGARRWYLRQAASLILRWNSPAQWAIWLGAAAALAVAFFMRHHVQPPFPAGAWASLAILGGAALSLRPADLGFLWRASVALGALLSAVAMIASVAAARLAPDPLVVWCYAVVFLAAGFGGAWRAHRLGTGILTAAATAAIAATLWLGLVTSISALFPALLDQLGPPMADRDFGRPTMAGVFVYSVNDHLMLVMFGITLGAMGAIGGRGLGSVLDRRATPFRHSC
jgi:hypothetical protein